MHFPFVLINRLNRAKSAVFLYWRFSLFLKDPLFQITYRSQQLSLCRVESVDLLQEHRYSVDIFLYSGPSAVLSFDGKQNTT